MQMIIFLKSTHPEPRVRKDGVVQKYHVRNHSAEPVAGSLVARQALFKAPEVRNAAGKLLAPNGQVSKLTEGQWHQVRSPQFKAWFGDWELATNQSQLAKVIAVATGKKIGAEFGSEPVSMPAFRTAVRVWAKANLESKYKNIGSGLVLEVRESGIEQAIQHGGAADKLRAFEAIPDVLRHGVVVYDGENPKNPRGRLVVVAGRVGINGADHYVSAGFREDANGRLFYDHELIGVDRAERLTSQLGESVSGKQPTPLAHLNGYTVRFLSQVANASKVVDPKTGEPLVVFHGTASDFPNFDVTKQGQSFGAYEGAFPRDGFWFTDSQSNADWYSHVAANGLEGDKPGGGRLTMPTFLSIKNPYHYTAEMFLENGEEGIPTEGSPNLEGHDGVVVTVAEDNDAPTPEADAMWATYAPKHGAPVNWPAALQAKYESLLELPPTVKHTHYVAFNPSQIKSATGNSGAFSLTDNSLTKSLPAMPRIILFRTPQPC